jgi:hypothetical protein
MSNQKIINTQIRAGIWEGELPGTATSQPDIQVAHQGTLVDGVTCIFDNARQTWRIKAPIPAHMISDGMQTFVVTDAGGTMLGSFALLAGDALDGDLRTEIDLLRNELEILKSAFRRHCAEG